MSNTNGTTIERNPKSELLDMLLSPPASNGTEISKSLLVEAREKAVQKSSRAMKTWHKTCLRDAVLILAASGDLESAQQAAVEFLKLDLNR